MRKRASLPFLFFLIINLAFAQKDKFGGMLGVNYTITGVSIPRIAPTLGLYYNIGILKKLDFRPEISVAGKSFTIRYQGYNLVSRFCFLEIPLLFNLGKKSKFTFGYLLSPLLFSSSDKLQGMGFIIPGTLKRDNMGFVLGALIRSKRFSANLRINVSFVHINYNFPKMAWSGWFGTIQLSFNLPVLKKKDTEAK